MINPESQFMSPLRVQPSKKQRGGSTPTAMSMSNGSASANRSVGVGPPPTSSAMESSTTAATSTSTSSATSSAVSDGVARRRAELRRLQQQKAARTGTVVPRAPSSGPPAPTGRVLRHNSDLFPTVPKSPGSKSMAAPPLAKPSASTSASSSTSKPPPPPIARKLEFPSKAGTTTITTTTGSGNNLRAKSAPPVRPPPPPPKGASTPVASKDDGHAHSSKHTTTTTSTKIQTPMPPRTSRRPAPVSVEKLLATSAVTPKNPNTSKAKTATNNNSNSNTTTTPTPAPPGNTPMPPLSARRQHMQSLRDALAAEEDQDNDHDNAVVNGDAPDVAVMADAPAESAPKGVESPMVSASKSVIANGTTANHSKENKENDAPTVNLQEPPSATFPLVESSAATARLEQTLQQVTQEKVQALSQVIELEAKLVEARQEISKKAALQPPPTPISTAVPPQPLQRMLHLVEQEGEQAALQWAREQVVGAPPLSNSHMDIPGLGLPSSPRRTVQGGARASSGSSLAATTRLLLQPKAMQEQNMEQVERQLIQHFRQAVSCSPFEFTCVVGGDNLARSNPTATFILRRPYGLDAAEIFADISPMDLSTYSRRAHVSAPISIQVAVLLQTDEGFDRILLSDAATVRYQTTSMSDWKTVDVDHLDRPLGNATYIDNEGVERDYSLDTLVEQAFLVRDQYCRTIISTALGFKDRPAEVKEVQVPAEVPGNSSSTAKPPTSSVACDTADIPYPPATIEVKKEAPAKSQKQEPIHHGDAGSSNILLTFVGMLFHTVFGFVWWIFIGLPLAILRTTLVGSLTIALASILFLYLRETVHNGTTFSYLSSSAYSNAPGIM